MQKITQKDIESMFERCRTSDPPENFMQAAKEFAKAFEANQDYHAFIMHIFAQGVMSGALQNGPISVFCTGFQMGREFEASRNGADDPEKLSAQPSPRKKRK